MPMQSKTFYFTFFSLIILIFAACNSASPMPTAVPQSNQAAGNSLIIGDISDEAAETIKGTQPLAEYLAAQLESFDIHNGEVKIAPDLETMIQWLENDQVDIYFDSPYPALVIRDATGALPILRRQKYGVSSYHSVFIVRADSSINNLDDLLGNVIAFEEPFSTSGYMLPLSHLVQLGFQPVETQSPDTAVANDEIGYIFSTADNTTIQWVVSEKVLAGVIDNVTFARLPQETQNELRIIAETEDVPRQVVLVRPDLDPELISAIENALLTMDETEEGRQALEVFLTTEFDRFPEGAEEALTKMEELYRLVIEVE